MSQFTFLHREWASVFEAASKAETAVHSDPRAACFYARRALELAVGWAYKHDPGLRLPYQDNLSALIHEPSFKQTAGEAVFSKARVIATLGNRAVHSYRAVAEADALAAAKELFHVAYWFARTYGRAGRPAPGLAFNVATLPRPAKAAAQSAEQLRALEARLREKDESLAALLADKTALDEELKRLRAEVAAVKQAAIAEPDTHDYSEAETRDYFIDLLLKEAGWPLDAPRDREYEVGGMPNMQGKGYVDYVLWDDSRYPPRRAQGFYKKVELERLVQRRETRRSLAQTLISPTIVERHYQTRAIRRIAEAFERDQDQDADRVQEAKAKLDRSYAWLSARIGEGWANGAEFSIANCAAAPALFYADWMHPIPAGPVQAYRARLLRRPSVAWVVDGARPWRALFPLGAPDRD